MSMSWLVRNFQPGQGQECLALFCGSLSNKVDIGGGDGLFVDMRRVMVASDQACKARCIGHGLLLM